MKKQSPDNFSSRLTLALRLRGMTRADLARRTGISAPTISRWNALHIPGAENLDKVCRLLKVRREWLITGTEPMGAYDPAEPAPDASLSSVLQEPGPPLPLPASTAERLMEAMPPPALIDFITSELEQLRHAVTVQRSTGQEPAFSVIETALDKLKAKCPH